MPCRLPRRAPALGERRPMALAALAGAGLLAAVYGSHVQRGAFYLDDWMARLVVVEAGSPPVLASIPGFASFSGHRPGYVLYASVVFTLFGGPGPLYGVLCL